jgi:hypothetical protein
MLAITNKTWKEKDDESDLEEGRLPGSDPWRPGDGVRLGRLQQRWAIEAAGLDRAESLNFVSPF